MKYPENILEVAALLPDYMGFIFWENRLDILMANSELPKLLKKQGFCKRID
jgi:phosphoribosylanthranilate isomerase